MQKRSLSDTREEGKSEMLRLVCAVHANVVNRPKKAETKLV